MFCNYLTSGPCFRSLFFTTDPLTTLFSYCLCFLKQKQKNWRFLRPENGFIEKTQSNLEAKLKLKKNVRDRSTKPYKRIQLKICPIHCDILELRLFSATSLTIQAEGIRITRNSVLSNKLSSYYKTIFRRQFNFQPRGPKTSPLQQAPLRKLQTVNDARRRATDIACNLKSSKTNI